VRHCSLPSEPLDGAAPLPQIAFSKISPAPQQHLQRLLIEIAPGLYVEEDLAERLGLLRQARTCVLRVD
jgi:hypothetical protein